MSLDLILHKAKLEYERRQRAYAELLEDEQELEALRLAEEQVVNGPGPGLTQTHRPGDPHTRTESNPQT